MKYSKIKIKRKKYNYGLGVLKVILSFTVILTHCLKIETAKNKYILFISERSQTIHVPAFFTLSFYFMHDHFISLKIKTFLRRLERLIIPYLGWPIIIYALNNGIFNSLIKNIRKYPIKELKNQILWGNRFIPQLWFQLDLIMITIIFYGFIFIFKKFHLFCLQLLAIFAYFLEYSGYNFRFFQTLKIEQKVSLGRFAEVIPYTVTGFSFASLKVFDILNAYKIKTLIFSVLTLVFLEKYSIFSEIKGVRYFGFNIYIKTISLIFIFLMFPSDKITNSKTKKFLRQLTNYTPGIFYLHFTVFVYFRLFIESIKSGTFLGCVVIYIISYLFSFIGNKISGKSKFKNLFT